MLELLKIATVFALLVLFVKRGWDVGKAIIASAVFFALIFGMGPQDIINASLDAVFDLKTIELVLIVISITALGKILKHLEKLDDVINSFAKINPDVRFSAIAAPAFIGLLPMPGGALLSAPFTKKVLQRSNASKHQMTAINYWFRHIWEYMFPLYPGLILSAAIFGQSFKTLALTNFPYTIASAIFGIFILLSGIGGRIETKNGKGFMGELYAFMVAIWPIAFIVSANLLFDIPLLAAIAIVFILLWALSSGFKGFGNELLRDVLRPKLAILIFSVMIFKNLISESNAVGSLPQIFLDNNIPFEFALFFIPFIVGLLIGLTVAYVGMCMPVLSVFIVNPTFDPSLFMIAYLGGFMGTMLSPVHLCLILSNEYYGSDLKKVYRKLIPLVASMTALTAILYLVGWPGQIL